VLAEAVNPLLDPWRYQLHPEVWVLVGALVLAYVYVVKVLGPRVVTDGPVVSRRQVGCFAGAMALLWFASDWPVHDIGEEYLYSAHMVQHMVLSYFVPPLALLATPEWFARLLFHGRGYRVLKVLTRPVVAGAIFNLAIVITHIPAVVNASTENGPLHYGLHTMVVVSGLVMWMPVVSPLRELQLGSVAKAVYLFLVSVVMTIPAAWLVFAEGAVYEHYDHPVRVWGMSVNDDQQLAGAIMKVGGGLYLWSIVVFVWFRRFAATFAAEQSYRRSAQIPSAEITGHDELPLTTADVDAAFSRTPAPDEPVR
jgi:putative membrane protein